jgi:hypothetical protein
MYYRRSGRQSGLAGGPGAPASRTTGPAGDDITQIARRNKQALCDLVSGGIVPGLIGYLDGRPAGWISLGPREDYLKLRRSRS